jgi:hypothetical protein
MMLSKLHNLIYFEEKLMISGSIPSEVGNLSNLSELFLKTDYPIPSEIGILSNLGMYGFVCAFIHYSEIKISMQTHHGSGSDLRILCKSRQYLPNNICAKINKLSIDGCLCRWRN